MIDGAIRQAGLVVADQSDAILARNVLRRDDYKFAPVKLWVKRDLFNNSARNPAANGRCVEHSRQGLVIDVPRRAGYFVAAFLARHRLADEVLFRHAYPCYSLVIITVLSSRASEGSVVCRGLPIPRFARNNNISLEANLSPSSPSAKLATAEHGLPAQVRSFHHTP